MEFDLGTIAMALLPTASVAVGMYMNFRVVKRQRMEDQEKALEKQRKELEEKALMDRRLISIGTDISSIKDTVSDFATVRNKVVLLEHNQERMQEGINSDRLRRAESDAKLTETREKVFDLEKQIIAYHGGMKNGGISNS